MLNPYGHMRQFFATKGCNLTVMHDAHQSLEEKARIACVNDASDLLKQTGIPKNRGEVLDLFNLLQVECNKRVLTANLSLGEQWSYERAYCAEANDFTDNFIEKGVNHG